MFKQSRHPSDHKRPKSRDQHPNRRRQAESVIDCLSDEFPQNGDYQPVDRPENQRSENHRQGAEANPYHRADFDVDERQNNEKPNEHAIGAHAPNKRIRFPHKNILSSWGGKAIQAAAMAHRGFHLRLRATSHPQALNADHLLKKANIHSG